LVTLMTTTLTPNQARGGEIGISLLAVLIYSLGLSTLALLSVFALVA
jgi:hypothetical protein